MNWRNWTDTALEDAYKEIVGELFKKLAKDPTDEGVEKFVKELEKAQNAYDRLVDKLEM